MTFQVLVVSGNPGLGMLLGRRGFEVDDCRPTADWPAVTSGADAIVLDLGTVPAAAAALSLLGSNRPPVLLVGQADEEWSEFARNSGSSLIYLPLTPDDVLSQLHDLLRTRIDDNGPETSDGSRALPIARPDGGSSLAVAAPVGTASTTVPPTRSKKLARVQPSREAPRPAVPRLALPPIGELVVGLLGRIAEVTSLSDVASVILADAVERCEAEAGALLIQDGDSWTVQASHALRPLEQRLHVDGDSWLIERVIERGLGLLVQGSDIARQRLAGVPVASWENLVAAPIGGRQGLVLLGAHDRTFSEADLGKLVVLDDEAAQLITRAVQVRALARALAAYLDDAES